MVQYKHNFNYYDKNLILGELDSKYKNAKQLDKYYPSCYRQNILVMLAKRLIDEEQSRAICKNRHMLNLKLAKEIATA